MLVAKPFFDDKPGADYITGSFYSELAGAYLGLKKYNDAINTAKKGIEKSKDLLLIE